ncbi:hypothetical protein ACEPAI_6603 [Sanghuangporus weigelae]
MTVSMQFSEGHIVALALPLWGHTKPLCALIAKIVQLRRAHATLFTDVTLRDKVLNEVARQFATDDDDDTKHFIRVVALTPPPGPFQFDSYKAAFVEAYKTLWDRKPIAIAPDSDISYEAISAPQLAVVDFFCYEALKGIRSVSGTRVPVYAWQSGAATAVLHLFGPENLGGRGDLAEKISQITAEDSETRDKEIEMAYRRFDGKLIELPGLPPMYDYEHAPQIAAIPINQAQVAAFVAYSNRFFSECDGVIHSTSRAFEGEALKKWQEWYGTKPTIAVGPLSPPASAEDIERERAVSPVGEEVEIFLNNALDKFGPNSTVYISFGTVWWSSEPEKIWTFIDVLLEQGIPFLLSHASPVATIPDEISTKVKVSGLGYVSKWLPQQVILRHKACGWFVSHCGHNSVMESLTSGVPLICWPYDADQPANAANIASVHGAGYELFEVRNGDGLRPVHRLGDKAPACSLEAVRQETVDVFTKARGKDGEAKRAKAQWFGEHFAKTWEEGGEGWIELEKIVAGLE